MINITLNGRYTINPRMIMLIPIAQITCNITALYRGLNVQPKVIITTSTISNQIPLFIKKPLRLVFDFFVLRRKADVPARNTKMGAQKCVIHLVKNRSGVVVARSVG